MKSPSVTFATKTWKEDYTLFLADEFEKKFSFYDFDEKYLMINNGVPDGAKFPAKTHKVQDTMTEVLKYFDLDDGSFTENGNNGLWYSIAELTAIYFCKTKYFCYVQGDCTADDFVTRGLGILEKEKQISVVSPYSEVNTYGEMDMMFSDQAFLVRTDEFKKKIYNFTSPDLDNYPEYGGNSFEKMVGRYLHNSGQRRFILYENYVHHKN